MKARIGYVVVLLFALGALVGGVCGLIGGVADLRNGMASRVWPTVEARITTVKLQGSCPSGDRRTRYRPDIQYVYRVQGREYEGDNFRFDGNYHSSREWADRLKARYSENSQATIHYNPRHPDLSVLEPGFYWSALIPMTLGIVFTAIGGLVAFIMILIAVPESKEARERKKALIEMCKEQGIEVSSSFKNTSADGFALVRTDRSPPKLIGKTFPDKRSLLKYLRRGSKEDAPFRIIHLKDGQQFEFTNGELKQA